MYTNEILARAIANAEGFSRQTDVVPLLDTVVQILSRYETANTLITNTANGRLPYLVTANNNYGPYDGPANSWRVSRILLWGEEIGRDYGFEYDYVDEFDVVRIHGNRYFVWSYAHARDALEGGLPQIEFTQNPGTHTQYFHVQAYRRHPTISSDRIQLQIPDSRGAHQTIVVPSLVKLIEAQNHGNYVEATEYIEQTMKPRLLDLLGQGAQGKERNRATHRPW